jgi:hypothetical protein
MRLALRLEIVLVKLFGVVLSKRLRDYYAQWLESMCGIG